VSYTVLVLDDAEHDLRNIHSYIQNQFSESLADEIYREIRDRILLLEDNPNLGTIIPQLEALGITNYRHMVVSKKNRVVYELDETHELIYVYLICNDRQDYEMVLRRRVLQR
jgi:plasmid stabilization system protein ParE